MFERGSDASNSNQRNHPLLDAHRVRGAREIREALRERLDVQLRGSPTCSHSSSSGSSSTRLMNEPSHQENDDRFPGAQMRTASRSKLATMRDMHKSSHTPQVTVFQSTSVPLRSSCPEPVSNHPAAKFTAPEHRKDFSRARVMAARVVELETSIEAEKVRLSQIDKEIRRYETSLRYRASTVNTGISAVKAYTTNEDSEGFAYSGRAGSYTKPGSPSVTVGVPFCPGRQNEPDAAVLESCVDVVPLPSKPSALSDTSYELEEIPCSPRSISNASSPPKTSSVVSDGVCTVPRLGADPGSRRTGQRVGAYRRSYSRLNYSSNELSLRL